MAEIGIRGSAEKLARSRVLRPPLGLHACAVLRNVTTAVVWRVVDSPAFFNVLVLGRINGCDHEVRTNGKPMPDEVLSVAVAECGFPLGSAPFYLNDNMGTLPDLFRRWTLDGGDFPVWRAA